MLTLRQGTTLALSSAAPLYSAAVTAPLLLPLIGGGAPLAYLLALLPVALVCYGMACNNHEVPDKGTVYIWGLRDSRFLGWFGGFCLALTGIIATAGLAYVAVDVLVPGWPVLLKALAGMLLIAVAQATSLRSVQLTSTVQILGVLAQVAALVFLAWHTAAHGLSLPGLSGGLPEWGHAIVLAVFAYWGFDSIFALAEESERAVPRLASLLSLALMLLTYALYAGLFAAQGGGDDAASGALSSPVLVAAISISAFMSLGTTLLPTARGIASMAEHGDAPSALASPAGSALFTAGLSMLWLVVTLISPSLFMDSIDALSVFVGLYFMLSSLSALRARRGAVWVHALTLVIMGVVVVLTFIDMLDVEYGMTSVGGFGGVGVLVIALLVLGLVAAGAVSQRARSASD